MVEVAVDGEEEVAGAAVEDDLQVAVAEIVDGCENGISIPIVLVFVEVSQVLFYAPVIGERAEIDSATGGAWRP